MDHRTQKMAHMLIHLVGLILAIFGVYAAFKFHDLAMAPDLTSLHSWLGIATVSLFALQWLLGFATFWLPGAAHADTSWRASPSSCWPCADWPRGEERRCRVYRRGQAHQRHRDLHPPLRGRRRVHRRAAQGVHVGGARAAFFPLRL
jgi:hypothetical protein